MARELLSCTLQSFTASSLKLGMWLRLKLLHRPYQKFPNYIENSLGKWVDKTLKPCCLQAERAKFAKRKKFNEVYLILYAYSGSGISEKQSFYCLSFRSRIRLNHIEFSAQMIHRSISAALKARQLISMSQIEGVSRWAARASPALSVYHAVAQARLQRSLVLVPFSCWFRWAHFAAERRSKQTQAVRPNW